VETYIIGTEANIRQGTKISALEGFWLVETYIIGTEAKI
jgi:hypothetical protein